MAAMLSLVGRTLAIDLDSQGDLTNLFDGVRNETELVEELDPTIAELMDWTLEDGESLDYRKLTFEQVVKKVSQTLDLIPAGLDLGEINYSLNRYRLSAREYPDGSPKIPPELYMVKDVIDQVRGRYDFIVLDMPPNIETLNIGALLAANRILIPLELEAKSILVIRRNEAFLNRIREMHPGFQWDKILCVPNKYSKQSIKMKAYSALVDRYAGRTDFVLSDITLPQSVIIDRSAQVREPIFAIATKRGKEWKSDLARAKEFTNYFWAIAHEILDVEGEALVFPMAGLQGEA
jgi:chromosome partitioning protein